MTVRAYKLGALGQDDLTGVKCLAVTLTAANPNYMTFEYPVGTDYQVPVGKIFYITKMDVSAITATSNTQIQIGYGDNGVSDGAVAPTNPIYLISRYWYQGSLPTQEFNVIIPIPAEKYIFAKCFVSDASVTIYGIEV